MEESGVPEPVIERDNYPTMLGVPGFDRFSLAHILQAKTMVADPIVMAQYQQWTAGISFETGRKIRIGGPKHIELGRRFYTGRNLFTELAAVEPVAYVAETARLWEEYTKRVDEIGKRNKRLLTFCQQLGALTRWNEYVEFEGRRYGIRPTRGNVHQENDCGGLFTLFTGTCYKCNKCGQETPTPGVLNWLTL